MKVLEHILDPHADKFSLQQTIRKKISEQGNEDAFFLCDLGTVIQQHEEWTRLCPGVEPFYAVKCNNDPALLQSLASLGTGFDCASRAEIEQVLSLGVAPERIIFANPCKMKSHIEFARDKGVAMMTFDDEHEMEKIKKHYPDAKLVLRILPPPSKAQCNLGCKYGVLPDRAPELVTKAVRMEMNLVGVSFHVGSGVMEVDAFSKAISAARRVFDVAEELGLRLEILDIGGGFPGHEQGEVSFSEISANIQTSLAEHFPVTKYGRDLRMIAEPGRYFASAAYTLVTNIIGKRDNMLYINDGVYGSFNCLLYDHATVDVEMVEELGDTERETAVRSVWGPTCDGLDCVLPEVELPDLEIGAWLYFRNMGAYTLAAGSTFNGMPRPGVHHWCSAGMAERLAQLAGDNMEDEDNNNQEERKEVKEQQVPKGFDDSWAPRSDLTFSLQSIYTNII